MNNPFFSVFSVPILVVTMLLGWSSATQAESLYGALYEAGHTPAADGNGFNKESNLMYHPGTNGFINVTSNDGGTAEWWTSDQFGLNWTHSTNNPLDPYKCTQPGRHTIIEYQGDMYFAGNCTDGATIFKLTGLESIEKVYTKPKDNINQFANGYPTATVFNNKMLFFYSGGITICNGSSCTDVTNTPGQPAEGAPLEVSKADATGFYAAFTSGEVMHYSETTGYTEIGNNYLEDTTVQTNPGQNNLPAIEVYNDTVYVGNLDFDHGTTIFKYDETDTDSDGDKWEVAYQADKADTITNKMEVSTINGKEYLVFFTANGEVGTNMFAIDETDHVIKLVESGLGSSEEDKKNREIVSTISRSITDGADTKNIVLFGTQVSFGQGNPDADTTYQTHVFLLQLGTDLAVSPKTKAVVSNEETVTQAIGLNLRPKASVRGTNSTAGKPFLIKVPKKKVNKGDVFSLIVNGKQVTKRKAKKNKEAIVLTYQGAKNLAAGSNFTVRIGRRLNYGKGRAKQLSRNTVKGNTLTVTVQ